MFTMFKTIVWFSFLVALVPFVWGETIAPDEATRRVEDYFNNLGTYQARFTQRTTGEAFTQEGVFYLKRPAGQFLWKYESPDRQRLIATGTKLYFVNDERSGAVTELPIRSGLSRLFTGRKLSLAKEGLKVVSAHQTNGHLVVVMQANPSKNNTDMGGIQTVTLTFANQPMQLIKADVLDTVDALTEMTFTDIAQGTPLDANLFRFTPRLGQI